MKFLKNLGVGDKFKPAHPDQVSLNRLRMPQGTYIITKIFAQSPHTVISRSTKAKADSAEFFSLDPYTPVLAASEPLPSADQVLEFLSPNKARKKVVGYRLLWNGKTPLKGVATGKAADILGIMYAVGKREYGVDELSKILDNFPKKFTSEVMPSLYLRNCSRRLVDRGLLEELLDDYYGEPVRAANLHIRSRVEE